MLSGGQDSTTCLFWAKERFGTVHAVAFDYGQRHRSELEAAREIAELADVELAFLELGVLSQLGGSSLVRSSEELSSDGGLEDREVEGGLPNTFVPGRNLLFLSVAAAYAVQKGCRHLVVGVSETDYSGYPDCRQLFLEHMVTVIEAAMPSSTGPWVIEAPLLNKDKSATVLMARRLGPACWKSLGLSVTCYQGLRPGCGECPSCKLREAGFEVAGLDDPALGA